MKRRHHISKSDMGGFIVLLLTIFALTAISHFYDELFGTSQDAPALSVEEQQELSQFSQQIKADSLRRQKLMSQKYKRKQQLSPFAFDPNTADSATLNRIGLKSWQIKNLLKYRHKGGKWKTADDFANLYGLSKEDFKRLRPFIQIKTPQKNETTATSFRSDSLKRTYQKKYETGTVLSLNEADTTALKGIPGIGSYYAGKICRYRQSLGGFVSVQQLKEIEGLPEGIEKWFTLSQKTNIRKTRINHTDFKGLIRHPYLNYEQVKDICNYIRKYGKIKSLEELSNSEHFTTKDIERLKPYLSFE